MGTAELQDFSSDSEDDLYTKSIDLRKVKVAVTTVNTTAEVSATKNSQEDSSKNGDVVVVDDDDCLDLPDPETGFVKKPKRSRRNRVEQLARKELQELEKIMSEPTIQIVSYSKRPKRVDTEDYHDVYPDVTIDCKSSKRRDSIKANTSASSEVIELDREVNLFVNVFVDKKKGKNGRFMTILRDEPFDNLRLEFAKELKCNQLDVMIHVNNVDAGPGDTPDSMGLDVGKLHVVDVFSLNPNSNNEDFSTDPSFIPVKCIFASGRPRCVYIKLAETYAEAKKRIKKTLHLTTDVEKLVFDNDVLADSDTPESLGMEAEDVVEVYVKKS